MLDDYELYRKALSGDEEATKIYCGSYTLVQRIADGRWFRCKGDIPEGYTEVDAVLLQSPYDKDGFLLPRFWALPRI